MSKFKTAAFLTGTVLTVFGTSELVSPTLATADSVTTAAAPAIGCTDGVKSGDDICTLPTGTFVALDGTDWMYPQANIEANDVPEGTKPVGVSGVSELDPSIAYLSGWFDSSGSRSFGISITYGYDQQFEFIYMDGNGVEHNVTVTPYTRPLAAAPTITKMPRKGMLRACEPSIENGGDYVEILYGQFQLPGPDGYVQLSPGSCQKFRVHRHRIDAVAYDTYSGRVVAEFHIRHIKLPKGDVPPEVGKRPMAKQSLMTKWQLAGR